MELTKNEGYLRDMLTTKSLTNWETTICQRLSKTSNDSIHSSHYHFKVEQAAFGRLLKNGSEALMLAKRIYGLTTNTVPTDLRPSIRGTAISGWKTWS